MEATQPIVIDENRQAVVGELMRNVYIWMTAGLAITGIVAWLVSGSPAALSLIFGNQVIFWGMLIAELVLVLVLSAAIQKLSFFAAECLFTIYCALNGATFSSIFLLYELGSITEIFFVCAGSFAWSRYVPHHRVSRTHHRLNCRSDPRQAGQHLDVHHRCGDLRWSDSL